MFSFTNNQHSFLISFLMFQTGNKFRKIENKGKGKNKLEKGPSDLTLTQLMDPKESNDGTEVNITR